MISSLVSTLLAPCHYPRPEFLVHSVTSYLTKVVTLVGEEQLVDNTACSFFIWRLGITQLTVDMLHGFLLGVGWVFLKGVVDNA